MFADHNGMTLEINNERNLGNSQIGRNKTILLNNQ